MENDNQGNGYALKFLADMKAKYAALGDAIASVEKVLNIGALGGLGIGGEATLPPGSLSASTIPVPLPRGAFLGKSIADSIRIYLNAARARKGNKEIAAALKDGGAVSTGNFDNRINGALFQLKNKGEVLRFDDGWGLADWYPESFRNKVAEKSAKTTITDTVKPTAKRKRASSRRRTPKTPGAEGLQQRVESLLRSNPSRLTAQGIAQALGVNLGAVNLSLGKMAKARKVTRWPDGYQLPGVQADNLHEMPKAV